MNPKSEADDVITKLVIRLRKLGHENIIIVSGDKDFHQLISRTVRVYSESRKKLLNHAECQKEFGYHPMQCVDYLTLVGDDSDNIKGYPQIGHKRAMDLLEKYTNLTNFIESEDKHNLIDKKKLRTLIIRNEVMIDLMQYWRKHGKKEKMMYYKDNKEPALQKNKFLRLSAKYNMRKLMSSNFIKAFKLIKR
jgi:5'-3' exonuclease